MSELTERSKCVFQAKLAEQAERYDEMIVALKKLCGIADIELTVEERNLLSVGYKNFVGSRRASWRILSALEDKEKTKGRDENAAKIADYRSKVEEELEKICAEIIDMLKENLIPRMESWKVRTRRRRRCFTTKCPVTIIVI